MSEQRSKADHYRAYGPATKAIHAGYRPDPATGVVNAPSEVGTTISDHFDCRAYFVDGSLVHTLVVFDHAH